MGILVPAVIALTMVGLFAAAWLRYRNPVRQMHGKTRVAPKL